MRSSCCLSLPDVAQLRKSVSEWRDVEFMQSTSRRLANKLWMRQVLGPDFEPRLARAGFGATGGTGSVLAFRPNPDALASAALAWE